MADEPQYEVVPLKDKILVERPEGDRVSEGGIIIPEMAVDQSQTHGVVVAVGNGEITANGERIPPEVRVGDTVVFPEYAGKDLEFDGNEYFMLSERDVFAVIRGVEEVVDSET